MWRRYPSFFLVITVLSCAVLHARADVGCSIAKQWSLDLGHGSRSFFQGGVIPSPYCQSLLERGSDFHNANHTLYAVDLTQGRVAWQWQPQPNDTFDSIMYMRMSPTGHRVYLSPLRPQEDGRQCSVLDAIDTASGEVAFTHSVCGKQQQSGWTANVIVLANSSSAVGRGRIVHYLSVQGRDNDYQLAIAVLDATTGEQLSAANITTTVFASLTAVDEGREGYMLLEDPKQRQRSFLLHVDANSSEVDFLRTPPAESGVQLYSQPLLTLDDDQLKAKDALSGDTVWSSSDPFMLGKVNLSSSAPTYHTYYAQLDKHPEYFAVLNAALVSSHHADAQLTRLGQVALYRLADGEQLVLSPVVELNITGSPQAMGNWIWWYELDDALLIATFDAASQWCQLSLPSLKPVSRGHYLSAKDDDVNFPVSADGSYVVASPSTNSISGYPAAIDALSIHPTAQQQPTRLDRLKALTA
jgi:hypothetical protein